MNPLKASIYALYANEHNILELLEQIDWSTLNHKWQSEMDKRIDRESAKIAQQVLSSNLVLNYDKAVQESAMACTNSIAELLSVLAVPSTGKAN